MTLFLNFRSSGVGGGTVDAKIYEADAESGSRKMKPVSDDKFNRAVTQRDILFATHGFNVSMAAGIGALANLEKALNLPDSCRFIGILWPGDSWLPVVNYPFEGEVATDCGRRLARFCDRRLTDAASLSFISHSLGARLVLEAAQSVKRRVRSMCLTAGAINNDCLTDQYATAFAKSDAISVLASRKDQVLKLAYPVGDIFSELFDRDRGMFRAALGYQGPRRAVGNTRTPWQISDSENYNHGDYLPPGGAIDIGAKPDAKWVRSARYMRRAFLGQSQEWPR